MTLYRWIMALLAPLLLLRARIKGETGADLGQRLGRGGAGPVDLWLHGASLGELTSAKWLVQGLLAARPGLRILITANTLAGRSLVQGWHLPGVATCLAPLDTGPVLRRFLTHWRPKALLSLEAEFWPLRFALCADASLPVLMLGARMSDRSFLRWQKRRGLAVAMLSRVRLVSAQDERSRRHLIDLGVPPAVFGPDLDLKAQAFAHLPDPARMARSTRADWLLAASTHPGEDAVILRAFAGQTRFAHLILAPRHPARADQIISDIRATGLAFDRRSQGASPGSSPVFLADTLGEMELWYARCGAVVIGGTFVPKGGHTPWEPLRHGCAILHGPDTSNFARPFADLDAAGGALPVTMDTLGPVLTGLDAAAQDRLAEAARIVLQAQGDGAALLVRIRDVSGL